MERLALNTVYLFFGVAILAGAAVGAAATAVTSVALKRRARP